MTAAVVNCLRLLTQLIWLAFCLAFARAGSSIAARIAIMAMTTSNSISVKALPRGWHAVRRRTFSCEDGARGFCVRGKGCWGSMVLQFYVFDDQIGLQQGAARRRTPG